MPAESPALKGDKINPERRQKLFPRCILVSTTLNSIFENTSTKDANSEIIIIFLIFLLFIIINYNVN